jgi:hypothetical protein
VTNPAFHMAKAIDKEKKARNSELNAFFAAQL